MAEEVVQTPPAWKAGKLAYGTGLTLDTGKKMLEAGEKEAQRQGVPMAMAIVDAGGNLLAFHRMDNAILVGTQIAIDKAFTAVFGKQHSGNYATLYQSGILVPLFGWENRKSSDERSRKDNFELFIKCLGYASSIIQQVDWIITFYFTGHQEYRLCPTSSRS